MEGRNLRVVVVMVTKKKKINELISQFPIKWRATVDPLFQRNVLMFGDFQVCLSVCLFILLELEGGKDYVVN